MNRRRTARAKLLRRHPTDAEPKLWARLRAARLAGARFRRQQPIGPYVVDFVCQQARLVVEVDGGQHASNVAADDARTRWLTREGFCVIRFWNSQVLGEIEAVVEVIQQQVERRRQETAEDSSP